MDIALGSCWMLSALTMYWRCTFNKPSDYGEEDRHSKASWECATLELCIGLDVEADVSEELPAVLWLDNIRSKVLNLWTHRWLGPQSHSAISWIDVCVAWRWKNHQGDVCYCGWLRGLCRYRFAWRSHLSQWKVCASVGEWEQSFSSKALSGLLWRSRTAPWTIRYWYESLFRLLPCLGVPGGWHSMIAHG